MTDAEMIAVLHGLGIDRASYRVVALLPLVQTAWADGPIDPREREVILRNAEVWGDLGGEGRRVLENWLDFEPSPETLEHGHRVVAALLRPSQSQRLAQGSPGALLAQCEEVARAAGKLFGVLSRVSPKERAALKAISRALSVGVEDAIEDGVTEVVDLPLGAQGVDVSGMRPTVTFMGAGDEDEARLVWLTDDRATQGFISVGRRLSIGRGPENPVQIANDGLVSRVHCVFRFEGGRYYVHDEGSTNGTLVNGDLVKERRLFGGETIQIGHTRFRFELGP